MTLCIQWAHYCNQQALQEGRLWSRGMSGASADKVHRAKVRAALGFLPKSTHLPQDIDAFEHREWLTVPSGVDLGQVVPGKSAECITMKKNTQVLQVVMQDGKWSTLVGTQCDPEEFMSRASHFRHPASSPAPLPPCLQDVVQDVKCNLLSVHKHGCQFLHSLCQRAKELAEQESQDHAGMARQAQHILQGKRLRLLDELIRSSGLPDTRLAEDIRGGLPLTGWIPASGHMLPDIKPPRLCKEELLRQASSRNKEIWSMIGPSGDAALDKDLWAQTLKDIEQGWAVLSDRQGPPERGVLSRRFGIRQGHKVRAIDDFSISRVNDCVGTQEKIGVMSTGDTTALALAFSSGPGPSPVLMGRCFDLKSAYRQLAVRDEDLDVSQVGVWDVDSQQPRTLLMSALPFGASASVWNFIRLAVALWFLGVKFLRCPWTDFYDDYTVITVEEDVRSLQASIFLFFQILGWKVAKEGDKSVPFAKVFQALGVCFDLTRAPEQLVCVSNTESRRLEVRNWCLEVLQANVLSPAQCLCFQGQVAGKSGAWQARQGSSEGAATILVRQQEQETSASKLSAPLGRAVDCQPCA